MVPGTTPLTKMQEQPTPSSTSGAAASDAISADALDALLEADMAERDSANATSAETVDVATKSVGRLGARPAPLGRRLSLTGLLASGGGSAKLLVGAPSARPSPARAGAEPVSLVARREAGTDAATLKAEGKACKELRAVGYDWRELIEAGFAKAPLMNAGFNVTRLGVTGCDELGISGQQLREVGTLSCCCCFHDLSLTFHGRP